jgi:hypothetical protein
MPNIKLNYKKPLKFQSVRSRQDWKSGGIISNIEKLFSSRTHKGQDIVESCLEGIC